MGAGSTATPAAAAGGGRNADAVTAADEAIDTVVAGLDGGDADLVVVFLGGAHAPRADEVAERVRARLSPRRLVGATAGGVVAGDRELEDPVAVSVWAASMPGVELRPLRFPPPSDGGGGTEWPDPPPETSVIVVLADPFSFPADAFLSWTAGACPGVPVCGGLASGAPTARGNRLLLDDLVVEDGAVAVAIGQGVRVRTLVSQGCRPVGSSYVVTRAERNLLHELAGKAAVERVREVYADADESDRALMRSGLHIGVVLDEYREDFGRGDFLVRGVLGAQADGGGIAVGDTVPVGRTVRFHVRDAVSADEDLRAMLDELPARGHAAVGALLFTCNGRGSRLFGRPDHDAGLVSTALDGAPLAGFFAAGELGPVGTGNFLHGFTASLLLLESG